MKKFFTLVLAIVLVFSLSACKNKSTSSKPDTNTPTQDETFVKPENYTSVLLVNINPQFKLYLDENNVVLAVEPVNDDAKSFSKNIDFKNKSVETIVENIVEESNKNGFIKENTTVNFEITEQKDDISKSDMLSKAASAAQRKAAELKIEIKTQIKENNKQETVDSKPGKSEDTQNNDTSNPTTSEKPEEHQSAHTHVFSAATCTAPKKCSCGEINGAALGHKWQDATCKAPKTCSVCKATEGNTGAHKYTNGKCVYCNDTQVINPKTGLKEHTNYYHVSDSGDGIYSLVIYQFYDSSLHVNGVYSTNEEWKDGNETITYKGKTYYTIGSGGPLPDYTLTDTEIIIKYSDEFSDDPDLAKAEYRLIVNSDYDLEVTSSTRGMFEKGDILDLVE